MIELIKHAAVKLTDGQIMRAKNHGECLHMAYCMGLKQIQGEGNQGFVTNKGRYVNRTEAAEIAFSNYQISKEVNALFSEDLWSPEDNGKYRYCYIKGYLLIIEHNND